MMSGLEAVPQLQIARAGDNAPARQDVYHELRSSLPEATTAALQTLARQHQLTLTPSCRRVVSAARPLHTQPRRYFGLTVSGRRRSCQHRINGRTVHHVLPMRVRIKPDESLIDCLREIQEQQMEMRQYEYTRSRRYRAGAMCRVDSRSSRRS